MTQLSGFKRKSAVTLSVLKMAAGVPVYVRFDTEMHVGKDTGQIMNGKKMEPATVANVTDLETGEQAVLICATVMQKEIQDSYPGHSYKGKCFEITMIKVPEKKYNLYQIFEIEADEAQVEVAKEEPATAPAKGKGK